MLSNNKWWVLLALGSVVLTACSAKPEGRYQMRNDQAPLRTPTAAELTPLEPRYEPLSRQGNMDSYSVFGQTYHVLPSAQGYSEVGRASWYGEKFHGHLTSNGEYYDMYGLSAAHRYLPLPTYVKVTNLNNGREAIVRVNDRGPFHPERIIDLSYAAAYKLDMLHSGTAPVRVEAIFMPPPLVASQADGDTSSSSTGTEVVYIQLTALSDPTRLTELKANLAEKYALNATSRERNGLHRLLLGPFNESQASEWLQRLRNDGFNQAFRVNQ
ncbi:septal ring lytic transglycosylase RlpA family protein [Aliidiomarina maris]|uniref:Endolytic peptidoglycan transglycosylase RlpA n=1 Tax=Aliidiomarina maris TaxID=531312 RepID=A0A327WUW1_9GAMM|nr:septal ring lytic transglycosylase RlpA family protein [Aliidiomarina maris]MBA3988052.1 septal ring lytic transglycosylase RlpA [Idiomarina sp.]MCL5050038.1 septal ring lytic transglycosylase RlpA family protein [Bacillota bacterium]RAJ96826.1 rare lipoprotein A [Aliidiomarina maris]RUO24231.1 septal ring lytic transglycosylase RlpA [Aliidiomarina maris]